MADEDLKPEELEEELVGDLEEELEE